MSASGVTVSMPGRGAWRRPRLSRLRLLLASALLLYLPASHAVVISFGSATYNVSEGAGFVEIDVHISEAPDEVNGASAFFVAEGPPGVYVDPGAVSVAWAQGDASSKTISIGIVDNDIVDPIPKTFDVFFSDSTGDLSMAGPTQITVFVHDDDPPVGSTLSIVSGDGQDATERGLDPLIVAVSGPNGQPIENALVTWSVFPAGAASLQAGTVTGPDGMTANTVTIEQFGVGAITVAAVGQGASSVEFTIQTGFGEFPTPVVRLLKLSGDHPGNSLPGSEHTLVVQLLDATGEPLPEQLINWSVEPEGSATLAEGATFTDSEGISSNVMTVVDRPGVITVTAGAPELGTVQFAVNSFGLGNAPGLTEAQRALGSVLEDACGALDLLGGEGELSEGQQGLLQVCNELEDDDPAAVKDALDQIMPKKSLAQGTLALEGNKRQHTNVKARLSALRGGATGFSFSGFNLNYAGQSIPGLVFAQLAGAAKGGGASADGDGAFGARLGGFINGSVSFGDRDASASESGFDFTTRGLTAGLDYRFTDELVAGATIGLIRNDTDFDGAGGSTEADGYSLAVFGTWYRSQRFYIDGIFSIGRNDYDMDRRIFFGGTDVRAASSTDGTEYSISIGGGYELNRDALSFGPYGRLNYVKASIDGYQEQPAGGLEMIVGDQDVDSLVALLGGQISRAVSTRYGVFSPLLRLEWAHEFQPGSRFVSARFVNDPNQGSFRFSTDRQDSNYFNLGVGVSALLAGGKAAFVDYEQMIGREHLTQHTITAGLRLEF